MKAEGRLGSDSRSASQSVCSLDKFDKEPLENSTPVSSDSLMLALRI